MPTWGIARVARDSGGTPREYEICAVRPAQREHLAQQLERVMVHI